MDWKSLRMSLPSELWDSLLFLEKIEQLDNAHKTLAMFGVNSCSQPRITGADLALSQWGGVSTPNFDDTYTVNTSSYSQGGDLN